MDNSSPRPDISVVICFRDWGLARLIANVRLHLMHSKPLRCEVIVSDYGSADPEKIRQAVEAAGGRVVRVEATELPWSRSAALNAGVEHARAEVVVTTDADMLFSPRCYSSALEAVRSNADSLYLLQCRDLPRSHGTQFFERALSAGKALDFDELREVATLRPRWGMGGFAAFSLEAFFRVNGYDERMKVWGAEDADFAKRFRLSRMPLRWLNSRDANIFHIWHPSTQKQANEAEETRAAIALNREIYSNDQTAVRNPGRRFQHVPPLISVIIAAQKHPRQLRRALQSCRSQTFPNFEVIVVGHGDTGACEEACKDFADHRFRCIETDESGAAAAWRIGSEEARGRYAVLHDEHDLMVSTRLERHLAALWEGTIHGSYCGVIDFNDEDGSIAELHPGKELSVPAMLTQAYTTFHRSLMVEASIFREFQHDDYRMSGIDCAILFAASYQGLKLAHTGSFGLLRRHRNSIASRRPAIRHEPQDLQDEAVTGQEPGAPRALIPMPKSLSCDNGKEALGEVALYFPAGRPQPE